MDLLFASGWNCFLTEGKDGNSVTCTFRKSREEEFEDKITVQNRAGTSYIYSPSDMGVATNKSYSIQYASAVYAYGRATNNKSYATRFARPIVAKSKI